MIRAPTGLEQGLGGPELRRTPDVISNEKSATTYEHGLQKAQSLLIERRFADAATASADLASAFPDAVEPLLLLGKAHQHTGRFDDMLRASQDAIAKAPRHVGARLQFVQACIFNGQHDIAVDELSRLESSAGKDHNLLQQIGEFYAHAGRHADACRCYSTAVSLAPEDARALYNLASAQIAVGQLDDAERNFGKVVERNPHDYDAWQNRSTLRRQTASDNHIAALSDLLEGGVKHPSGEVQLCYALAKEYEDLGEFETSFHFLKRGADCRRRLLSYRVDNDIAVMRRLRDLFDEDFARRTSPASERRGPVFVMGLPRSGTTLVDRILSSHSAIESVGEVNDFALSLTRLGGTTDKQQLLDASVSLDMEHLGDVYVQSLRNYGCKSALFVDKTPANYLYLGLIAKALPAAVVFHVQRHPVDSCFAMYRTLFRMGYPFSYDLDDIARYYIAYHKLMQHWRRVFGDSFMDVSYEALVDDQETVSRKLIAYCGLDWEEQCLHFEKNSAPVATASAAQVRKPIYRDSLARWRRYQKQLEPLTRTLADAGIDV